MHLFGAIFRMFDVITADRQTLLAGRRGYAPASKLLRYHQPAEEPPPSPHLTLTPEGMTGARRHSYTPEGRPLTVLSQPCFKVIGRLIACIETVETSASISTFNSIIVCLCFNNRSKISFLTLEVGHGVKG